MNIVVSYEKMDFLFVVFSLLFLYYYHYYILLIYSMYKIFENSDV